MGDGAKILNMAGNSMYFFLAMSALWGLYCLVVVWARVAQKRFRNEPAQNDFLEALEEPLMKGDFDTVYEICEGDKRALPQMMQMAILNRQLGYKKARLVVLDRFQRDVLTDLEYRLNWVGTMIKTAPMLGLLGTVLGMMGAFATLATAESVDATQLAKDINTALYTTACGLATALPLVVGVAFVTIRIRKMEDLVAAGLTQFFDMYRVALEQPATGRREVIDGQRAATAVR
ncbi:MAG: MotA/TolQ/ExbB proton channel family protein [Pirellulaceae bacterium]|nr:MotA/TolQ/ExbB proton channel family protein [Planctomycetales bacterium]MCA9210722.1 MotA/TolQ/ExbB proton channel family protein [Planctomycetales bacterium]